MTKEIEILEDIFYVQYLVLSTVHILGWDLQMIVEKNMLLHLVSFGITELLSIRNLTSFLRECQAPTESAQEGFSFLN